MSHSKKVRGLILAKKTPTPRFLNFILFSREDGLCLIKYRIPKKLTSGTPELLQCIEGDVVYAGGVQAVLAHFSVEGGLRWDQLEYDTLRQVYIFVEVVLALLPMGQAAPEIYDIVMYFFSICSRADQDVYRIRVVGMYYLLFYAGILHIGQGCAHCHELYVASRTYIIQKSTGEIRCSACCGVEQDVFSLLPMTLKWMRFLEQHPIEEGMLIVGDEKYIKNMEVILLYYLALHTGRPLKSLSF